MPPLAFIIIVSAFAIGIYIGLAQAKKTKQLIADGKIIKRDLQFHKMRETFSLNIPEGVNLDDEIKSIITPEMHINHGKSDSGVYVFQGYDWKASLKPVQTENGTDYEFNFLKWKNQKYGTPNNSNQMNLLLTAVEKMFLKLDPNTVVTTKLNKVNVK